MKLNDGTHESEPEPSAAAFSSRIAPEKPIENMLLCVGSYAWAIVLDLQDSRPVLPFERNLDPTALGRVFDCVLSQIKNQPKEKRVVSLDPQRRSPSDLADVAGPCGQLV
jgi:hypothetical protein